MYDLLTSDDILLNFPTSCEISHLFTSSNGSSIGDIIITDNNPVPLRYTVWDCLDLDINIFVPLPVEIQKWEKRIIVELFRALIIISIS